MMTSETYATGKTQTPLFRFVVDSTMSGTLPFAQIVVDLLWNCIKACSTKNPQQI